MAHPTVTEFQDLLLKSTLPDVLEQYVLEGEAFDGIPYVFQNQPRAFDTLRQHLTDTLKLNSPKDITVVGSAKIGFSLSPHNFPRHFSDESDIDVVVVDEALFDKYWMIMVEWNYPRRTIRLAQGDWEWIKKRKNELFWGWFLPDRIQYKGLYRPHILKPLLDISNRWFDAFQSLALYPEFAERKVSGRLYRTFEHARLYHLDGLRQIKRIITNMQRA